MAKLFEAKEFINGTDATDLSNDQLIGIIRKAEDELKSLEAIESKSEHIAKKIRSLKSDITSVVAVLDARD